ncbi:hypothetical protein GOV04_03285 [Candidatus Woesearchaeota archaeon]|nr:hypothetical protein [Candidatus Woesearchaeota archaeon]
MSALYGESILITGGIFHIIGGYISFLLTKVLLKKYRENPKFYHAFIGFALYTIVFSSTGLLFLTGLYTENINYVTHTLRSIAATLIAFSLIK